MKARSAFAMALVWMIGWIPNSPAPHAEAADSAQAAPPALPDDGPLPLAVRWWGQACLSIETFWGFTIVIDPFITNDRLGYPRLELSADLVLVTHEHGDHNGVAAVKGEPAVLRGLKGGDWAEIDHCLDRPPNESKPRLLPRSELKSPSAHAVHVKGIRSFHDAESGARRGKNTMFLIETDGVRVLHCGDLGHALTPEQVEAVGPVDLLVIPAGGTYTVDASGAMAVIRQLKPRRFVWPIHYKTGAGSLPLAQLTPFLELARSDSMPVRELKGNTLAVARAPTGTSETKATSTVIVADFRPAPAAQGIEQALAAMRTDRQALIDALGKVSKAQLDHKPSDGSHTLRWNFEHTTATEIGFFSQLYHARDAGFPLVNWRPGQMPPAYKPRHPDWDTAEMVRHVQRVGAFTERFSYLLVDLPLDLKVEGTRFSVQSLSKLMVGHYQNHTTKAVGKFKLPDWPKE